MVATDGPQRGKPIRWEKWQRGILDAFDRDGAREVVVAASAQSGKTTVAAAAGIRVATEGAGTLVVSSANTGAVDFGRRLGLFIDASPMLTKLWPRARPGPNSAGSTAARQLDNGGFLAVTSAGSASGIASRTIRCLVADETARWPQALRGTKEGDPYAVALGRLADWGALGRVLQISTPSHTASRIWLDYLSADRRRLHYPCGCGAWFTFDWKLVSGRERGETPTLACPSCGSEHDERARRKLLRKAKWRPTAEPTAENRISFHASRLDSARATLASVTSDWRAARLAATNGAPEGLAPFYNLCLGQPHETAGAIELDRMMQLRTKKELADTEQSTVGIDVQQDRVYVVKMAFAPDDERLRVQDYAELGGAPDDPATWDSVVERIASAPGPPPTCMMLDAGFQTAHVLAAAKRLDNRSCWVVPIVGRATEGAPIVRPMNRQTGIAPVGTVATKNAWAAALRSGRVSFAAHLSRRQVAELTVSEALTREGYRLVWRPTKIARNDGFDASCYAVAGRHFRRTSRAPQVFPRLRAV